MEYTVKFLCDEEASVWVATSENIPGLALESASLDNLKIKVKAAIPELLALNIYNKEISDESRTVINDAFARKHCRYV